MKTDGNSWNPLPPAEVGPELFVALSAEKVIQVLKIRQEWQPRFSERFEGVCIEIWRKCFPSSPPPPVWKAEKCDPKTTQAILLEMEKLGRLGDTNDDRSHDITRMIRAALVLGFGHRFGVTAIQTQTRKTNVNSALAAVLSEILGTGIKLEGRSFEDAKKAVVREFGEHCENRERRKHAHRTRIVVKNILGATRLPQMPIPVTPISDWEKIECPGFEENFLRTFFCSG